MAIGFKGKYFTLAAITATVSASLLSAEALATNETIFVSKNAKEKEAQELDEESPTVVISKKIKPKKVDFFSANKTPTISTNLTDNIKIITSEELKLKGVSTLHEAISNESFSSLAGGVGQLSQIYLQGMDHKYTLFLINGVRLNDPSGMGANIDHILLDDVERIEIIKGAQSGVWGADAVSGVINIITKDPTLGIGANVGLEMGRYGHLHGTGGLSYAGKSSGIGVSVSRLLKDGPSAMSKKGESLKGLEDDPYRNTTVNITGYHWLNTDSKIQAGYKDINSFTHFDGGTPFDKEQSSYKENRGYLTWDYFWNSHNIATTMSHTDIKREIFGSFPNEYKGKSTEIEVKDAWRYDLDGTLVFGASHRKDTAEEKDARFKKDYKNRAVFASNTYRLNTLNKHLNKLVLTQALRYDHYKPSESRTYNKTTGKVGARYDFTNNISAYVNFGTAFRAPYLYEIAHSNKLDPEKTKSYSVGVDLYQLNINFFQNEVKSLINGLWNPMTGDIVYENISGKTKIKGAEVSYSDVWTDYLLGGGSFTYIDAVSKSNGEKNRLKRRPLYQATGFMTYTPIKSVKLTGIGKYIGSRVDLDFSSFPSKEVQTGRYFIADFRASYDIDKNWEVYARVDNVLDKECQEVYGYTSLGRSFYAGFNWKF
jgi:vitamin B12 transporter